MPSTLSLTDIQKQIEELASLINAPKDILPTYGESRHDGCPHITLNGSFFDYWVIERDNVIEHKTAFTLDDLFYWLFQGVTFQMAVSHGRAHQKPDEDFRRILFDYQLNLLETLNPQWKEFRQKEIKDILAKHPFRDKS